MSGSIGSSFRLGVGIEFGVIDRVRVRVRVMVRIWIRVSLVIVRD